VKDFLAYIGNDPASGWYQKKGDRNPALRGLGEIAGFCTGKKVTHVWSDYECFDEGHTIVQFFDDGSILEMMFVQARKWSEVTWSDAEVHYFGFLPNEVGRLE